MSNFYTDIFKQTNRMKKTITIIILVAFLIGCRAKDRCPSTKKHYHNKEMPKMKMY